MKILLLGKNGQLGWALQRALAPLGELIALDRHGAHGLHGDLADPQAVVSTIETVKPDVIVNAAAYTAVDKAESDIDLARQINATAPGLMAEAAASIGALLVHYSTDYVFDGTGERPWTEEDRPAPLNVYGRTKLEGEQAIVKAQPAHLIFRTSWVFASMGGNFAKTMLRLARERDALSVIDDQIGAPTGADLLADVTAHALLRVLERPQLGGIYHLAAAGETSWFDYAKLALRCAQDAGATLKVELDAIKPIPTSAYPTPAARPGNSRLNTRKLCEAFDLVMPPWEDGVRRMMAEVLAR